MSTPARWGGSDPSHIWVALSADYSRPPTSKSPGLLSTDEQHLPPMTASKPRKALLRSANIVKITVIDLGMSQNILSAQIY